MYEGTSKAKEYKELLQRNLRNTVPEEDDPADELVFMHDGG